MTTDPIAIRKAALAEVRQWAEGMRDYAARMVAAKRADPSIYQQVVDDFEMVIGHCDALADHPPSVQPDGWRSDMEAAPRDGTLLLLLVDYSGDDGAAGLEDELVGRTVGWNNFDNDGEDEWQFAGWSWSQDYICKGHGKPVGWQLMPSLPAPPAPETADGK